MSWHPQIRTSLQKQFTPTRLFSNNTANISNIPIASMFDQAKQKITGSTSKATMKARSAWKKISGAAKKEEKELRKRQKDKFVRLQYAVLAGQEVLERLLLSLFLRQQALPQEMVDMIPAAFLALFSPQYIEVSGTGGVRVDAFFGTLIRSQYLITSRDSFLEKLDTLAKLLLQPLLDSINHQDASGIQRLANSEIYDRLIAPLTRQMRFNTPIRFDVHFPRMTNSFRDTIPRSLRTPVVALHHLDLVYTMNRAATRLLAQLIALQNHIATVAAWIPALKTLSITVVEPQIPGRKPQYLTQGPVYGFTTIEIEMAILLQQMRNSGVQKRYISFKTDSFDLVHPASLHPPAPMETQPVDIVAGYVVGCFAEAEF